MILQTTIVSQQDKNAKLREAIGKDVKGRLSIVLYTLAIALAFWSQWVAIGLYIMVAFVWFVPDRRIERSLFQ